MYWLYDRVCLTVLTVRLYGFNVWAGIVNSNEELSHMELGWCRSQVKQKWRS